MRWIIFVGFMFGSCAAFGQTISNPQTNASALSAGTVPSARGGAGSVSGALKGNGAGVVSQAACGDLSNGTTNCSAAVGQLPGTITNDSASAGNVGEYATCSVASGSAVSVSPTGTVVNICSAPLTAGDWQCSGDVFTNNNTNITSLQGWISTSTTTNPGAPNSGAYLQIGGGLVNTTNIGGGLGSIRLSVTGTPTAFLEGTTGFSAGTGSVYGSMNCRRAR